MSTHVQHRSSQETTVADRVYSPDILPRLQSLLADLADIDLAFRKQLKAIENGRGDESLKRRRTAQLRRDHQERRAPHLAALEALQEQVRGCFD